MRISREIWLLAVPFVVIGLLWWIINLYIESEVDNRILENEIQIEETINEAVEETRRDNPHADPDISLDRLRGFLSDWD